MRAPPAASKRGCHDRGSVFFLVVFSSDDSFLIVQDVALDHDAGGSALLWRHSVSRCLVRGRRLGWWIGDAWPFSTHPPPLSADPNRSIRHLRDASATDGKAAKNLAKLRCVAACEPMSTIPCSTPSSPCSVFRLFYVMVFSYIYVTRIVVFLISSTIPFRNVWLGALFEELATLIFYFTTGYVLLEPDERCGGGGYMQPRTHHPYSCLPCPLSPPKSVVFACGRQPIHARLHRGPG